MKFAEAIGNTPQIKAAYCFGLKALGVDSSKIVFFETSNINGSVNIDEATKKYYPDENRWDYVVGYQERAYFFEIHPASSSDVKVVRKKYKWLRNWLKQQAPYLDAIKNERGKAFYWIYTNRYAIPKNSKQYRAAVQMGLIPCREFREVGTI